MGGIHLKVDKYPDLPGPDRLKISIMAKPYNLEKTLFHILPWT